ncbi:polysaccharide deacetylase family protein [Gilvimarinus sp. SDUM040013]|uniref:Polysaccharide deacetylase family protein n=1 Tax=Gilvimarinus gilvus TaxID=3058038 RepID=A0ABU4RX37_9GAMM|nr:polysaccharide deacetylase family protein [Gilvimarinus sp. SDUM040013]MDO3386686.1 polysaccharide deacetylase family protein [Gilvimarinus sp. SDUM040013]MDX6849427.1 polysaccharide deacetylase family protein [Gilvimarinus sp. SDUM040013]
MRGIIVVAAMVFSQAVFAGSIAITFDDSPTWDSHYLTGPERTEKLIKALDRAGVEQAMFFANTIRMDEAGEKRLRAFASAGHLIANHSHSHKSAGKLTTAEYLADVELAHNRLSALPGFAPFHRFPYLNRGEGIAQVAELNAGIKAMGYADGYVTVDNYDFYISHLFDQAISANASVDYQALESLYVDAMWQAIEFYDNMAIEFLGRSPHHVLLLHENDAAVLFVEALVAKIRSEGWDIIPASEAYQDPISQWFDADGMHGQGRVAAIAQQNGAKAETLKHPYENTDTLDKLFRTKALGQELQ